MARELLELRVLTKRVLIKVTFPSMGHIVYRVKCENMVVFLWAVVGDWMKNLEKRFNKQE
jgi:hypothetical protein